MAHISLNSFDFSALSAIEKIAFAHQLLGDAVSEMHGVEFTPEQIASFQADADACDAGTLATEPWEAVRARLDARHK